MTQTLRHRDTQVSPVNVVTPTNLLTSEGRWNCFKSCHWNFHRQDKTDASLSRKWVEEGHLKFEAGHNVLPWHSEAGLSCLGEIVLTMTMYIHKTQRCIYSCHLTEQHGRYCLQKLKYNILIVFISNKKILVSLESFKTIIQYLLT